MHKNCLEMIIYFYFLMGVFSGPADWWMLQSEAYCCLFFYKLYNVSFQFNKMKKNAVLNLYQSW